MNNRLRALHPYPFERLATLIDGVRPPADRSAIAMTVGEPKHEPPDFVLRALNYSAKAGVAKYPGTRGLDDFRAACADWIQRRFQVLVDPAEQVLPLNGTREGLFAIAQTVIDTTNNDARVFCPNPFYQIYEGAALLSGASVQLLNADAASDYLPDLDAVAPADWASCQLFYICSPANPSGAVCSLAYYTRLIELADKYDFVIVADECYCELYRSEPPPSLLQASWLAGRADFSRCLAFHSLSKRSNLPGLRSGFVAGDRNLVSDFLRYRTYHGSAMSEMTQRASIAAWADDKHVAVNRQAYNEKYTGFAGTLGDALPLLIPEGSFYLWPDIGGDDEQFCRKLYEAENVLLLPGSYLGRAAENGNPGRGFVRISLVPKLSECLEAAHRIRRFLHAQSGSSL